MALAVTDLDRMWRARALAREGAGRTWTNPMVGAVVVADGREVGAGFHRRCGEAHAESAAIEAAGSAARGATLYVNLEPCAHHGRTPPCVETIAAAGIARVVIPALDPDPRVRGRGVAWLRERGVKVDVGCDAAAAILDNHGYYHDRLGLAPTITLKMAVSADGMVARGPGRRDPVTGDAARADAHRLRAVQDAIVVGVETAHIDRPVLDCRLVEGGVEREPVPVVFDTSLRLPADNVWARSGREFIVVAGEGADHARARALEARGGSVLFCPAGPGGVRVERAVELLAGRGLKRILVEGGARLFRSFVAAEVWDALWLYRSSGVFGAGAVPLSAGAAEPAGIAVDEVSVGGDVRRRFVRAPSWERLRSRLMLRTESTEGGEGDVHRNH